MRRLKRHCYDDASMKALGALALGALALFAGAKTGSKSEGAADWSLQALFKRPFVWGTPPSGVTWSKQGHKLVFLWNAGGRRFLDLYSYDPDSRKLLRLTDLEGLRDDLNRNDAEKDDRRRSYVLPEAGVSDFDLSAEGSQVAFSHRGDLWIAKTDGSVPPLRLTHTKAAETNPQFSPDGRRLGYLESGALFTHDLSTGQVEQVVDASDITWYKWSPAGSLIAYTTRGARGRQIPLPNYSGRVTSARAFNRSLAGDAPAEVKLFVVDIRDPYAEGQEIEAGPSGAKVWHEGAPEWSPDGRRLLEVVAKPDWKSQQLIVSDVPTKKTTVLFENHDAAWVDAMQIGWSPDSQDAFFTCDRDGFPHLYRVAAHGGTSEQITRGKWEIRSDGAIYSQRPQWIGQFLYYASTEAGTAERQIYRIKPDGSAKEQISQGPGVHIGIESEDGGHLAEMRGDLSRPLALFVDGKLVTQRTGAEFAAYQWPETKFVSFPSRVDHARVAAKILLPDGYKLEDRSKTWPAVFFIHGSGIATSVLEQWGSYQEFRYVFDCWLTHQGYVVFDLDYRGSTGYGRDWRAGVYLDMGGPDLQDVLGEIDYARSLGNIDMRHIGIWGVSYGGFLTDMAMFRAPDAFRAGAAFSAVNDWENYNAVYTEQRLNRPEDDPEAYHRSSPIWYSQNLKNHLLIVHGFVDDNVMFQDAVQLAEKLIHEGRPFEEAFYPEESHGFMRDETLIDCFQRTGDFFQRYLKGPDGQ